MIEIIHMTAAYSNAVLVAVLPYVSDFTSKLALPVEQPITTNAVTWSMPSPYKDIIEDGLTLTNHLWFNINSRGFVEGYRYPVNWFFEQEYTPERIPQYIGNDNMTTNEAIAFARETIAKLGYSAELTHTAETPKVEGPFDVKRGHVPYCRVTWEWPKDEPDLVNLNNIQVEINMDAKRLVGLTILFSRTNNLPFTNITVGMSPQLESEYQRQRRLSGKMFYNTNAASHFPVQPKQSDPQ